MTTKRFLDQTGNLVEVDQFTKDPLTLPFRDNLGEIVFRGTRVVQQAAGEGRWTPREIEVSLDDPLLEYYRFELPVQPGKMQALREGDYLLRRVTEVGGHPDRILIEHKTKEQFETALANGAFMAAPEPEVPVFSRAEVVANDAKVDAAARAREAEALRNETPEQKRVRLQAELAAIDK